MLLDEIKSVLSNAHKTELRKFGLTLGVFFSIVAGVLLWKESDTYRVLAVISGVFMAAGFLLPIALKPVYVVWMSFAVAMGFIMTRLILTLLYSLVFTPAGLVMRLLGKDPLSEAIESERESYWLPREKGKFTPQSVERQF
ncbi:MAG: SxtJ family membrane protein [bacterium]